MSGSGEYTTTPNLGLFKPTYNADAENWGFHLNSNSDVLDAALVGGGSYIATGGTVPRTAADRAADVANVLDYGADPTGVADSSAAFSAAAAAVSSGSTRHRAVYLPTGTYRVNHQINLTACQAFYGDSRGSSVLMVDQAFDPAASAVIMVTASLYDAGPVLRDFGITFAQPQDQGSRANFKTLAQGGTSHPGGTGVKYPWAIASGTNGFRVQCIRLRIGGAWDGITTNGNNTVFWLDDIEMGALDCGTSLGEGAAGVQDFCHVNGYHFWGFEISDALYAGVYADGQTIAMRVGRCDGLDIRGYSSFLGRFVVTPDAAGFTAIHITNAMKDADQSCFEINGACLHVNISNIYGTAGTARLQPYITVNEACALNIGNYYSHSSSNYSDIVVNHPAASVTINAFKAAFFTPSIRWAEVQRGILRIVNGHLYLKGPRTVSAIAETLSGHLVVDNLTVEADVASGPLISVASVGAHTMLGRLSLQTGNTWTFSLPPTLSQTFLSPQTIFQNGSVYANAFQGGGFAITGAPGAQKGMTIYRGANPGWALLSNGPTDDLIIGRWNDSGVYQGAPLSINRATGSLGFMRFDSGISFGQVSVGATDLSKHISLFDGYNGINVSGPGINIVASNKVGLTITSDWIQVPSLPLSGSAINDAAAAAGGVQIGQFYRNGSVVMVRVT